MKTLTRNNIENIIIQRLQLETNRRILWTEFDIQFATLEKLQTEEFLNLYKRWDNSTRNKFIVVVGGRTNFNKTQDYFDKKVKDLN